MEGTHKSIVKNVGDGEGKLSYKQVVAETSPSVSASAVFKGVIQRQNVESKLQGGDGRRAGANVGGFPDGSSATTSGRGGDNGKYLSLGPKVLSLSPNEDMVSAILNERSRLKSIAIFFICLDKEALPARKFFDDWLASVWGKKLGIYVTYYRMIQKGLFVIFLKIITCKKEF